MSQPLEGKSPEEILKSALAQVVSLECRLEQLLSERDAARAEAARARHDLSTALERIADLEARLSRAEAERAAAERRAEEVARGPNARALAEAEERARRLAERQERWFARAVEWQRIADAGRAGEGPDLGGFIADLRQEVLANDSPPSAGAGSAFASAPLSETVSGARAGAGPASGSTPVLQAPSAPPGSAFAPGSAPLSASPGSGSALGSAPAPAAAPGSGPGPASSPAGSGSTTPPPAAARSQSGSGPVAFASSPASTSSQSGSGSGPELRSRASTVSPSFSMNVRRAPLPEPSGPPADPATPPPEADPPRGAVLGALGAIAARMRAEGRLDPVPAERTPLGSGEEALRRLATAGLRAPDPRARLEAARRVASLKPAGTTEALVAALVHEPDGEVRAALLHALGALGAQAARPLCEEAARDADPRVRRAALAALSRLGAPPPESALADHDPAVRRRAAVALGLAGDPAARPALAALAERDPDPRVRRAAAASLSLAVVASAAEGS